MSANASAPTSDEPSGTDEYDSMLDTLDSAIEEAQRKIESGRVYDAENEKVRVKWIRALAYAINVRRQVTTDRDLEELTERLETIEEQQGGRRMTPRRSKREVASWLDEFDANTEREDTSFDVREGVSAPFVTYEEAVDDGDDLPPGCEVAETIEGDAATYRVVHETDEAPGEEPA